MNYLIKPILIVIFFLNTNTYCIDNYYPADDSDSDKARSIEHLLNLEADYSKYPVNVQIGIIELLFNYNSDSDNVINEKIIADIKKRLQTAKESVKFSDVNNRLRITALQSLLAYRSNDRDLASFSKWSNIDNTNAVPLMMIANAYWQKGDIHQCLKFCEKAAQCPKATLNEQNVWKNILTALEYLNMKDKYLACSLVKSSSNIYDAMIFQHIALLDELDIFQNHFGYNIQSPKRQARHYLSRIMLSRPAGWNILYCAVYKNILKTTPFEDIVSPPVPGLAAHTTSGETNLLNSYYDYIVFTHMCIDKALNNKDITSLQKYITNPEQWYIDQIKTNHTFAKERNITIDICKTNWHNSFSLYTKKQ